MRLGSVVAAFVASVLLAGPPRVLAQSQTVAPPHEPTIFAPSPYTTFDTAFAEQVDIIDWQGASGRPPLPLLSRR